MIKFREILKNMTSNNKEKYFCFKIFNCKIFVEYVLLKNNDNIIILS